MKAVIKKIYLPVRQALLRVPGLLLRSGAFPAEGFIPKKILLIRVDRLGDMVLTTPAFQALKDKFPAAELCVLAVPAAGALISADPRVSRIILWENGFWRRVRAIWELRRAGFDLAIDPLNGYELKTALLAFLSGARFRLGYEAAGRGIFFNLRSGRPGRVHFSEEALFLLRLLGIRVPAAAPELFVSEAAGRAAAEILERAGFSRKDFLVAIHPGGFYPSQRWASDRFAEVAGWLMLKFGAKLLLIGSERERGLLDKAAAGLPRPEDVLKAVNIRPDVLCALMRGSRLFIGNNSGPLHIAAALGIPGVSTMGPTDPVKWAPLGTCQEVVSADVPCSPCAGGACVKPECMEKITVEMVKAGVERLAAGACLERKL